VASDQSGFFEELKRRHVVRVAIAYALAGWLLVQVATQVFPFFDVPNWAVRLVVILLAIGFPVAVAFAWIYEITPAGIRRTEAAGSPGARSEHANRQIGRKLNTLIMAVLVLVVVLLGWRLYTVRHQSPSTLQPAVALPGVAPAASVAKSSAPVVPAPVIPEKSVAVLPFVNDSGQKDEQFFSDGLSQDLITALSQFAGLKVINRDSAFQFRDSKDNIKTIAQQLGVAHILEGSVQRVEGEVRITATLVNAADGSILWSQRYDKPYKDLFALQDAITQSVADALKAKLLTAPGAVVQSDRPPSGNLDAYTAYLRGVTDFTRTDETHARQAIGAFQHAVTIDPRYAAAWAALSRAWARLGGAFMGGAAQQQAFTQARRASDRALQLAPDLAAAHSARSYLAYSESDWKGAQAEIQRALQLAPNDGDAKYLYGSVLATLGQCRRAADLVQQALMTNPRNGDWYYAMSQYLACGGRMADAQQALRTAIALQPQGTAYHEWAAILAILRGDAAAALAAAQKETDPGWRRVALALATQIGPDAKAADGALRTLIAQDTGEAPYQIAETYALRRDPDAVFQWLDRAWKQHDPGVSYLLYDPLILRYRDDPRFAAFCHKVGLPTTTDAVAMK
jgi:TolB-like protein/Tfp pilus assembly protein PilF